MKYFLAILLLLSACSKKSIEQSAIKNTDSQIQNSKSHDSAQEKNSQQNIENKSEGPFELFLGIHQIEYFADRMVLKSRLSGYDFAKKTTFERNGVTNYQVILGPFNTQAEAEAANIAIKSRTPDLDMSKVRAIK